jgi:hypothetical protein
MRESLDRMTEGAIAVVAYWPGFLRGALDNQNQSQWTRTPSAFRGATAGSRWSLLSSQLLSGVLGRGMQF